MPANNDYFTEVGNPGTATTLAAPGHTIGGTSFTVGSTSNWPTVTGAVFAVDTVTLVNGVEVRNPGSYTEWEGVVSSGTTITAAVIRFGTDQNYPAGSTTRVYIPVASSRENRLVQGIQVSLDQDGTLKAGSVDVAGVLGNNVVTASAIANNAVTTTKILDDTITFAKLLSTIFSGQVQTATNTGNLGGTMSYINLGGIKLLWLDTASVTVAGSTVFSGYTIIPPVGFFTTAPKVILNVGTATNNLIAVRGFAKTSSLITVTAQNTAGAAGDITVSVFMIGS